MSGPLTDRLALVTGAGGRLGSAIAIALAEAGARVVLSGRNEDRLAEVAQRVASHAQTILCDLATATGADELFAQLPEGPDVLVNNAGIASSRQFGAITAADLHDLFALNVVAPVLCSQHAARRMRERGGGKIINIGSIYGSVAPDPAVYEGADGMVRSGLPYGLTKAALLHGTRDLAVRLAEANIQVNMVSPGGIEADQPEAFQRSYAARTPAGRMAQPEDVVGAILFLSGPGSDYVTGQNLLVDGGFTAW